MAGERSEQHRAALYEAGAYWLYRSAEGGCGRAQFRLGLLLMHGLLEFGTRTVAKGQKVGCYDCHHGPNGD